VVRLSGHPGVVRAVGFSPDGRLLATAGKTTGSPTLWDLADPAHPARIATLPTRPRSWLLAASHPGVSAMRFSPDVRLLATAEEHHGTVGSGDIMVIDVQGDFQDSAVIVRDMVRVTPRAQATRRRCASARRSTRVRRSLTVPGSGQLPVRWLAMADGCADCGAGQAEVVLDGTRLCDRCADRRVAAHTGWQELPDPPAPQVVVGPDGTRCGFDCTGLPPGWPPRPWSSGATQAWATRCGSSARTTSTCRCWSSSCACRSGTRSAPRIWNRAPPDRDGMVREQEVSGRLVWAGDGAPYAVVIDGRTLSWEDFGRTLESFEGWRFRLVIDDIDDVRPDARR